MRPLSILLRHFRPAPNSLQLCNIRAAVIKNKVYGFWNFKLVVLQQQQIIEINYLNQVYDLHNAAEFLKIEYLIRPSSFKVYFNYHFKDVIKKYQLIFKEVSHFEVSPTKLPNDEDDTLEQIIYSNDRITFSFMGGMHIAVESNKVRLNEVYGRIKYVGARKK